MALAALLRSAGSGAVVPGCYAALLQRSGPFRPPGTASRSSTSGPSASPEAPGASSSSAGAEHSNASTSSSGASSSSSSDDIVYTGFFGKPHKRLKVASLVNTFVSLAAGPFILMQTDTSELARVAVAMGVVSFGMLTTAALHWFTSPYVHELRFSPATQMLDVKTLGLLGGQRRQQFHIDEVRHPTGMKPLATFMVNGRTFYVDKGTFPDAELLARLTPENPEMSDLLRMQQQMAEAANAREKGQ